jgi:hypothetical protein
LDEEHAKLWSDQRKPVLPWLVLRYPASEDARPPLWAGRFDAGCRALVDSPARREIARRLLHGDAVVWVLLEGGDRKQDDAAAVLLRDELKKLEKTLRLPDAIGTDVKLLSSLPVKIAFSTLRVARTDPTEKLFVKMLLDSDPDFAPAQGPIVFPLFGRGRAFDGLLGKGINPNTIRDTARHLIGACSCEIKRQNPGTDLLLAADWDAILDRPETDDAELLLSVKQESGTNEPARPHDAEPAAASSSRRSLLWFGVTVAGLMTLLTGIWVWRSRTPSTGAPSS